MWWLRGDVDHLTMPSDLFDHIILVNKRNGTFVVNRLNHYSMDSIYGGLPYVGTYIIVYRRPKNRVACIVWEYL